MAAQAECFYIGATRYYSFCLYRNERVESRMLRDTDDVMYTATRLYDSTQNPPLPGWYSVQGCCAVLVADPAGAWPLSPDHPLSLEGVAGYLLERMAGPSGPKGLERVRSYLIDGTLVVLALGCDEADPCDRWDARVASSDD